METIIYLAIFILGTIVGSFLNVVILRYNTGKSVGGRSMCFTCGKTLKPSHLVPLFSYILLRGKCAFCKTRISSQYPIIEALTGLAFVLLAYRVAFEPILFFYLTVFSILLIIGAYDYRHKIIPDGLVFLFIGLSLLRVVAEYYEFGGDIVSELMSGIFISGFFAFLWLVSGGRWMGFGDAKLALGIGWLLPYCMNVSAIVLSFFLGSIIGLSVMFFQKVTAKALGRPYHFESEIPFAPFLILATFITFAFNFDLLGFAMGGVFSCLPF